MLMSPLCELEWRASDRLIGFPAFLHANGFGVGACDAVQVMHTAARGGVLDPVVLRHSLQALLCGRRDEWRRFDELFDAWFLPPNRWQRPARRDAHEGARAGVRLGSQDEAALAAASDERSVRPRLAASPRESLDSADFGTLTQREHQLQIEALMRRLARRLKHIRLRREAPARRGRGLDLPATIRRSIASGGTPLHLAWRNRRRVRPRLVLLIDVSRSMALYSFFYLRLARALSAQMSEVRSFIFHTRVTAVSDALHESDPWRAQEQLQLLAQGWAGGTRIGESVLQFNREHAPRCVHSRTAVLILSDGYDSGDPAMLAQALRALRRRARRIIWINPLAARRDYTPVSDGMQAALPHVDLFAPGADLATLEAVLPTIIEML
jgi:uncharacterized protein with von Willebrand factor type A (vWA) domain